MASPRREVDFPLAGYASPGFHTWPGSADVLVGEYETGDSHPKKTFGEAFGAATGVSDPRLQKIRIRNNSAGGDAATVAGYAGPGFPTWPSGHIPQDTDTNALIRPRPRPFLKKRSEKRAPTRSNPFSFTDRAAPGSATHGYKRSGSKTTTQAAKPPL